MRYDELEAHLKAADGPDGGGLSAAYVVFGEDLYLKDRATQLFKALVDSSDVFLNLNFMSAAQGMDRIADAANTCSFFAERKVIIVRDVAEKLSDADKKALGEYLSDPNPTSVIVFIAAEEGSPELGKIKGVVPVDCSKAEADTIRREINLLLSKHPSKQMAENARRRLILLTLGNMAKIKTEIEKLKAYSGEEITIEDVDEIVSPDTEYQIFALSDAVSRREANKAAAVLRDFSENGIKSLTVINLLYGQYRRMLHAELKKDAPPAEIASTLGIKLYAVAKLRAISKNYTQIRLKNAVDYLHALQCDVLSGKRKEDSALKEAVLTLLGI